ncbi:MAG: Smr/MutS family protein [Treponema sp.]|jgi:DNA-nicking Smr family endonuclease|nr:Smr/MutS family protein [Treponema sp.]
MAQKKAPTKQKKQTFGDILDAWDRQTAIPQAKKHKKVQPEPEQKRVNPITEWIRKYGVYDKDAAEETEREQSKYQHATMVIHKTPDAVLDLHGLTRDQAWNELENFFEESKKNRFEKVVIIHGKGNHCEQECVLQKITLRFIELCPFVGKSGYECASAGGTGATWVLLKKETVNAHGK